MKNKSNKLPLKAEPTVSENRQISIYQAQREQEMTVVI